MSSVSEYSPRFLSGGINVIHPKPSEQIRRRSNRLSIINWRTNSVHEGSITHIDIFLGSLTAISEELAASLATKSREQGAETTMQSLEAFPPERYVDLNSTYRSPTRVVVFVLSTHVAGKPAPNAQTFLQWLRKVPTAAHSSTVEDTLKATMMEASAPPQNSSSDTKNLSPRTHRIHSNGGLQRHHSLTDAFRTSFRVNWRHPFGGGETESKPGGPLCGVQYAVFGVGNSVYRTFNATAKYVDSRLHELGAIRVCPLGLGDVSKDIEAVFAKWETQVLQTISYQPSSMTTNAPVTARKPSIPPPQVSLPGATTDSTELSISEMAQQSTVQTPTHANLKLPLPGRQGHELIQRRYSSAYTNIIAQRGRFDQHTAMPPLTDRR